MEGNRTTLKSWKSVIRDFIFRGKKNPDGLLFQALF